MMCIVLLLILVVLCFADDHGSSDYIRRKAFSFTYSANEFDFFNSTNNAVKLASSETDGISPNSYQLYLNVPLRDIKSKEIIGLATFQEFITVRYGLTILDFTGTFHFIDQNYPGGSNLIYTSSYSPQTAGNSFIYFLITEITFC